VAAALHFEVDAGEAEDWSRLDRRLRLGDTLTCQLCPRPCARGVLKQTENAGKLRIRTEDDERVRAHRKSLIIKIIRGEKKCAPGVTRIPDLRHSGYPFSRTIGFPLSLLRKRTIAFTILFRSAKVREASVVINYS
jgi:hypothetical protein